MWRIIFTFCTGHCECVSLEWFCIVTVTGTNCHSADLSLDSKCYRRYDDQVSWYQASNDCLVHAESLALFTNIGRPRDSAQLTNWLTSHGTDKSYWIGFVRSGWRTTDEGDNRTCRLFIADWIISCVCTTFLLLNSIFHIQQRTFFFYLKFRA